MSKKSSLTLYLVIAITIIWVSSNFGYMSTSGFYFGGRDKSIVGIMVVESDGVYILSEGRRYWLNCSPVLTMDDCLSAAVSIESDRVVIADLLVVKKLFAGNVYIVKNIHIDGYPVMNENGRRIQLRNLKITINIISVALISLSGLLLIFASFGCRKFRRVT